jgi:acetoacetyl-CoA synthetase
MSAMEDRPIYTPSYPNDKNVEKFRRQINKKRGLNLCDYRDLHAYSVHPDTFQDFWQDVWEYVNIKASQTLKDVFN